MMYMSWWLATLWQYISVFSASRNIQPLTYAKTDGRWFSSWISRNFIWRPSAICIGIAAAKVCLVVLAPSARLSRWGRWERWMKVQRKCEEYGTVVFQRWVSVCQAVARPLIVKPIICILREFSLAWANWTMGIRFIEEGPARLQVEERVAQWAPLCNWPPHLLRGWSWTGLWICEWQPWWYPESCLCNFCCNLWTQRLLFPPVWGIVIIVMTMVMVMMVMVMMMMMMMVMMMMMITIMIVSLSLCIYIYIYTHIQHTHYMYTYVYIYNTILTYTPRLGFCVHLTYVRGHDWCSHHLSLFSSGSSWRLPTQTWHGPGVWIAQESSHMEMFLSCSKVRQRIALNIRDHH